MRRLVACVGLALLVARGGGPALAGIWSPNGRWVAYQQAAPARTNAAAIRWLLDTTGPDAYTRDADGPGPMVYRLWATRLETGDSVLLDESAGPITAPAWHPDGTMLAFAKVVVGPDDTARYEVVLQEAPDRKRAIFTRKLADARGDLRDLARAAVAFDHAGRHLAAPLPQGGLVVVRVDDGRVLKTIDGALLPSWSPAGTRLGYLTTTPRPFACCLDGEFGSPRSLTPAQALGQGPVWWRDGLSLLIVRRQPQRVEVARFAADSGRVEWTFDLIGRPIESHQVLLAATMTIDEQGEDLFAAVRIADEPNAIVWLQPTRGTVHKRFHPFDISMPISALSLATRQKKLFLRLGPPDDLGPIGIHDLETEKLEALAPDEAARTRWLDLVLTTTRGILRDRVPHARRQDRDVERPTLLPMPGELSPNSEPAILLKRMARIARPLVAQLVAPEALDPEARLLLNYIQGDLEACLSGLDALEAKARTVAERLRWLGLRAQLWVERGDRVRAAALLDYLAERVDQPRSSVEESPNAGLRITPVVTPESLWVGYLRERLQAPSAAEGGGVLLGNPDNPNAELALPLDLFNRIDELPQGPRIERPVPPRQ